MLKKKRKPYKRLLAVLMTAAMCLSMSLCSMASVSAAQTTKGEESSASDSSNTSGRRIQQATQILPQMKQS